MSLDAKAAVKIGKFSRKGKNRLVVKAVDHDFQAQETLTPYGILLPDYNRLYLYCTQGRVTSDFIADCITDCWRQIQAELPHVQTLLLYQDNGPENHSRRTQFMYRMTQLVDETRVTIRLAYYPPYHSKYNPIERVWSALEQHWNGSLLDSVDTVLGFARTMSWQKRNRLLRWSPVFMRQEKSLVKRQWLCLKNGLNEKMGLKSGLFKSPLSRLKPLDYFSEHA